MRERNHFIGLWLNDEEYAHLREQSEMTGRTDPTGYRRGAASAKAARRIRASAAGAVVHRQ